MVTRSPAPKAPPKMYTVGIPLLIDGSGGGMEEEPAPGEALDSVAYGLLIERRQGWI